MKYKEKPKNPLGVYLYDYSNHNNVKILDFVKQLGISKNAWYEITTGNLITEWAAIKILNVVPGKDTVMVIWETNGFARIPIDQISEEDADKYATLIGKE
jgi:hypothetical protein